MASAELQTLLTQPSAFEQLLQELMSTDNALRYRAEQLFNSSKGHPDFCVQQLVTSMRQSSDMGSRQLCAVLLRKVLTKDDPSLWPSLSEATQAGVKVELLKCLTEEQQKNILRKVCFTVSELAAGIMEKQGWAELFPQLWLMVNSGQPLQIESAMRVFAELAHYLMSMLQQDLPALVTMCAACFQNPHLDVRLAAMRAVTSFVEEIMEASERAKFEDQVDGMLGTLVMALQQEDEVSAQEAIELFVQIAEVHPRFLRPKLGPTLELMLQVAESDKLESSTRQLAAELCVTLCEAREKAPGMMRKQSQYVARLFNCFMTFLLDIEDVPEWHKAESEEQENEGEGELYEVGQECLDRVSIALGGATIQPLAAASFKTLMPSPDWKARHAALICLAQIAEGCVKVMVKEMAALVHMCLVGLQDSNAKVRWAACQALGQMCTDLGPDIQAQYHAQVLPALLTVMSDFSAPRVQAHASAAIVNFSENCDASIVQPYLEALIPQLVMLLQKGSRIVQEGALTALASVADCAQQHFARFYEMVMAPMRDILSRSQDKSERLLRAKALECMSLVGMAVGLDVFRQDAHCIMTFIQQVQSAELDPEDPMGQYLLQAGARLCKALGPEFLPYLTNVMPQLLKSAQLKVDVQIADADTDGEEDEDEDEEVETIYIGDRKISIRTSTLEEKATACNMICCYVSELKEGFYPYAEEVTKTMLPLLKFYFHEDVRQAAVNVLPELVRSVALAHAQWQAERPSMLTEMVTFIWQPMIEALQKEPDADIMSSMIQSFEDVIDTVNGPAIIPLSMLEPLFGALAVCFESSEKRRQERLERTQVEDFDQEEFEAIEEENEQENEICDSIAQTLGAILRLYSDSVAPLVEQLMVPVGKLLGEGRTTDEHLAGVYIVDDILEYCPVLGAKYAPQALVVLLQGVQSGNAALRQSSAYGLGLLAEKQPAVFQGVCKNVVELLLRIMSDPSSMSEDNREATENAVAALGKVLEFHPELVDTSLFGVWVDSLPLRHDLTEAKRAHAQLVRFLETPNPRFSAELNSKIPKLFSVLVEVLSRGDELVEQEDVERMKLMFERIRQNLPQEAFQGAVAALPPANQAQLSALLSGHGIAH